MHAKRFPTQKVKSPQEEEKEMKYSLAFHAEGKKLSYLFECQSACILEVGSLSSEVRMRLIFDDKDDVGGYFVGGLISLALEIDKVWPLCLFHLLAPHRVFSFAPSSNFLVSDTCADTAPFKDPPPCINCSFRD